MLLDDPYVAKAIEYLLAIAFLLLFVPFWRYATGGVTAAVRVPRRLPVPVADWFSLPADVFVHPGHAWARVAAPGVAAVGLDDFARQLVGPLKGLEALPPGSRVRQGERAWTLKADSKSVDMLSPVSGVVVALNDELLKSAHPVNEDAYGHWVMKVQAPQLATDKKQLLEGRAARQFLAGSWDELSALMTPELGTIMHDGGTPMHGFARGIDETNWDDVARRFLRS